MAQISRQAASQTAIPVAERLGYLELQALFVLLLWSDGLRHLDIDDSRRRTRQIDDDGRR